MGTDSKFEPELRLAWAHEFGDTDRDTRASFAGQPESFMIKAVERESDSAIAGLGVNYYFKENVTLYLDYDGEYRDGYDAHAISGGFRYNF
jgi:outer membrane autotransporter protein